MAGTGPLFVSFLGILPFGDGVFGAAVGVAVGALASSFGTSMTRSVVVLVVVVVVVPIIAWKMCTFNMHTRIMAGN